MAQQAESTVARCSLACGHGDRCLPDQVQTLYNGGMYGLGHAHYAPSNCDIYVNEVVDTFLPVDNTGEKRSLNVGPFLDALLSKSL